MRVLLGVGVLAPFLAARDTTRESVSTAGVQGNQQSFGAKATPDGRFVVFASDAYNLVPGDTNAVADVFVRDRALSTTERVSVSSTGAEAHGASAVSAITADGNLVVFVSSASDLVPGDTNAKVDVFVRDRLAGTTERISVGPGGVEGTGHCQFAVVTPDGRYVAFSSQADNLAPNDTNGTDDVFRYDRQFGTVRIVSARSTGVVGNGTSTSPSISDDGRFVAFASAASNLAGGDTNGAFDVYVSDLLLGTIELASRASSGAQGSLGSMQPSLSGDGRFLAFASYANNLVPSDTNGSMDVFRRELQTGALLLVSADMAGGSANGESLYPSISGDGRFVAFGSHATDLLMVDANGIAMDAFVRDCVAGTTEFAGVGTSGLQANFRIVDLALSANGRYVCFTSMAANLVAGDTNQREDVFLRDRGVDFTAYCFGDGLDPFQTTQCPCGNIGAPGNGCANSVTATGARLDAVGLWYEVTLTAAGMPATSTCIYLQGDALDEAVFGDGVRCTGGTLLRLRTRANSAGASSFPDSTDTVTLAQRGGMTGGVGGRRYYQTHYRNVAPLFCPPATFNVTNGVIVDW
ncbi:MAG: PD40 domain-containing protein [Planctomycetes bacterium]|nr:PD40 domain-containing protein [Planctomycetota bacterium]